MSKSPDDARKPSAKAKGDKAASTATFGRTIRETIESVVIAFILAFMFRTFEAEAFVIPTGSMANTLKGRHKDLECPRCEYCYQVSASEEVDDDGNRKMIGKEKKNSLGEVIEKWLEIDPNSTVASGTCPNCRFSVDDADTQTSYSGDRILVAKFPFEFFAGALDEPRRWEVIVFKYPLNAKQNYIKRLVGLPGEDLKIHHGDVFIGHDDGKAFAIARKPPHKVLAMMQTVYDNEHHTATLDAAGWPQRWQAEPLADSLQAAAWKTDDGSKSFHTPGGPGVQTWLRYQHFVPSFEVWDQVEHSRWSKENNPPQPQLITDMYAYNTAQSQGQAQRVGAHAPDSDSLGLHWVGDLVVECDLTVEQAAGTAIFELVKGGRRFQCRLDLEKNQAELSIDGGSIPFSDDQGRTAPKRTASPPKLAGAGTYHITFANVDEQLYLWINGTPVEFDGPATFEGLVDDKPTAADLSPVGIASEGAGLKIGGLKLWRDVYYIAAKGSMTSDYTKGPLRERPIGHKWPGGDHEQFVFNTNLRAAFLSSPQGHFGTYDWNWETDFSELKKVDFTLEKDPNDPASDQFFMMGDNSPSSSDSRLWQNLSTGKYMHYVPRNLLVGKALFIYWPHSFDKIPGTGIPFPFFPNFSRMGFVR